MADDDFEPRLGRMRSGGGKGGRRYLQRVLAATNLARGAGALLAGPKRRFDGSRIGRGAGVGRVLGTRGAFAALQRRRVIIKTSIVKLGGRGARAAAAHLRYLQRDGTTRDGAPGRLYSASGNEADPSAFRQRSQGDRHQFRFIVSAEDGAEYEDLRPLTRRLMARMEQDLGTRLDWIAVDHFNTGHPHSHIILRGIDHRGADLVIARDYLSRGLRERAAELVDLDLGPRTVAEVARRLRAEIEQERLTSIDRSLIAGAGEQRLVDAKAAGAFEQSLRAGRLSKLGRLGLAEPAGQGRWRLAPDMEATLQRMGERGDIVRTMQRVFTERRLERAPGERVIYGGDPSAAPLVGRVLARGLSDEHRDRHFLIVDGIDGRSHYVDVGTGAADVREGAIVRVQATPASIRPADRTIAAVAAANDGRYDIDAHLAFDPSASEEFARSHVRRLEAMRRLTGSPEREPSGSWRITPDHLERAAAYEAARQRARPVTLTLLWAGPLEQAVVADAATWLDQRLLAPEQEPAREAGFGAELRSAEDRRRQWLIGQGLAEAAGSDSLRSPDLLAALRRRELLRVAAQLSDELGLPFAEARPGERLEGMLRRPVELVSGRHALIERSRDFVLVPWRPVLEPRVGKTVSGIMRPHGVSWSFGRSRGRAVE